MELDQRFTQQRVIHATGTFPWLSAFLNLESEQFKPFYVGLDPIPPGSNVRVEVTCQLTGYLLEVFFTQRFRQVDIKLLFFLCYTVDISVVLPFTFYKDLKVKRRVVVFCAYP